MDGLSDRLAAVRARVDAVGRPDGEVRLVAVTKGFGADAAVAARAAGLVDLGENYAQELLAKVDRVDGARWHFLGPIQRNKVKALAPHVALWHAVDRPSAGAELLRHPPAAPVLVQVNLAGDPSRPGVGWDDAPRLVDELGAMGLDVRGLMGVATRDGARSQFRRLAALRDRMGLVELSIGMSGDLEVAVEEGATIVRVGTSLFGPRPEATTARR